MDLAIRGTGDIGTRGETIAAIGILDGAPTKLTIDAQGLTVAPGFIDIHTHARRGIFLDTRGAKLHPPGRHHAHRRERWPFPLPLAPLLEKLGGIHMAVNFGTFVGQGSIRQAVLGLENRKATPEEIAKMKDLTRQAMQDGALGLSTGLFYVPGNFTPTEEVIQLAQGGGRIGGMYVSHVRDEAPGESIACARPFVSAKKADSPHK